MRQSPIGSNVVADAEHVTLRRALFLGLTLTIFSATIPSFSAAQDWSDESDDSWSQPSSPEGGYDPSTGWSFRAGIGFIDDPTALLLNFEMPYAFDRWVSVGPMFQIGLDDNNTVVAPTVNLTVKVPDLPGSDFDWIKPFGFVGMGFAYIEDDNRRNDDSSAGFLIDFGFGVEYQISESFFIGTQMMFNFLPEETLGQSFFYSWQIGGARIAF